MNCTWLSHSIYCEGSFQFGAIMNKLAVNIQVQVLTSVGHRPRAASEFSPTSLSKRAPGLRQVMTPRGGGGEAAAGGRAPGLNI